MSLNPYAKRPSTKQYWIAQHLLVGKSREDTFRALRPLVLAQTEPMIFSNNVNGRRIPIRPVSDQVPLLFFHISRIYDSLHENSQTREYLYPETTMDKRNYGNKRWRAQFYNSVARESERGTEDKPEEKAEETFEEIEETRETEEEIVKANEDSDSLESRLKYYAKRLREIREFLARRNIGGQSADFVSTRAFVYGRAAIEAGILPDEILHSFAIDWPADMRREAGINPPDPNRVSSPEGKHKSIGYIRMLAEARVPIYLCGPAGSGKSVIGRHLAEEMDLSYGELPLNAGVSRADMFGSYTREGYVSRPFCECYENGGVFLFDEIDAADPNMLLSVNNAIANGACFNPVTGKEMVKHPDFVVMAAANTYGTGANREYTGRERLDKSTIDRFRFGRVAVDYDSAIEESILFAGIDE